MAVLGCPAAENLQNFRGVLGVQVPLLAFLDPRLLATLAWIAPPTVPPGGQFGVGIAAEERRVQLCEAVELAGSLRRDPLAVVTLERRVGNARLRLEPGDLHVRLQRRRHNGV